MKLLSCAIFLVILHFSSATLSCNRSYLENASVKYSKRDRILHRIPTTGVDNIINVTNAFALYINNNDLPELCEDAFASFPRMETFELSSNNIRRIEPGAFKNLKECTVNIRDNQLTTIEKGIFNGLNIFFLSLRGNQISYIHAEAFDDMPYLEHIYLDSNKLRRWNSDWFKGTPRLLRISFNDNQIESIPANAFKNIHGLHLDLDAYPHNYPPTSKAALILSRNQIRKIHKTAFFGNETLTRNNDIHSVNTCFSDAYKKIYLINLNFNKIKCLKENVLLSMDCIKYIYMENNPVEPECAASMMDISKKNNIYLSLQER